VPAAANGHGKNAEADTAHGEKSPPLTAHGESHAEVLDHGAQESESHHKDHGKEVPTGKPPTDSLVHAEAADQGDTHPESEPSGPQMSLDERAALRELAEIHASRGDLDRALPSIRKLLRLPTEDVALLSLATEVYLGTGNYQEALATAHKAYLHAAPGRTDLKVAAIMARYRLGEVGQALEEAAAAVKEHPTDLDLLMALATMEVEMGPGHSGYGSTLAQVLKQKPNHTPALYLNGRKAQLEGNYKDAELLFRAVLKQDPRHAKARAQLGMALYHLDRLPEAETEFLATLAVNPKDYNTWFNLGELHLRIAERTSAATAIRTRRAEAMEALLKAVELNPDHAEAHFRIGVLLSGNGQYKEAIRHLEAAREVDSYHVPTLVQLAVAYENLKRLDLAKPLLEKALELDPEDKIAHFKLKRLD
ncbi:MAG TPA: tetratricopeptide repeat protein, partial [Fibrobacteria bacterium]|nr:tetratricopeptide repeat protein [Fibrobacteria bacterium]